MSFSDASMFYIVLIKKMNIVKTFFVFLFICFIQITAFGTTLECGITYTEETARVESFEGVKKINPNFIYLPRDNRYWFNLGVTNNVKFAGKSNALIFGLIPYSAYHVCYEDEPDIEYLYEKRNGKYKLFAIIDLSERNKPYPQRFIKYDNYGHLMSVEFNTGYESFIYDNDGKLIGHWQGNKGQTTDKKVKIKQELKYFEK